jgi:predicted small secreted protein
MKKTVNMKKLVLVAMILTLSGCATVDGFGRDVSGAANRVASWF